MTLRKREDAGNWKNSRSHSVESWLRKWLWTCLNRDYMMVMLCYWIILTYTVTKPFWHMLCYQAILTSAMLPNYSDRLCYQAILTYSVLPSHSDVCHVTKPFWHMLCYQNVLTCYVTRLTYTLLPAAQSLWHNLTQYVCVGSSDAGKRFGIISRNMFVLAALMQGSVWYGRKMRKVVMMRGLQWQ